MADDSEDEGGSSLLFSEKQIPEFAQHYPDYVRLKTLINELSGFGGARPASSLRLSSDMKRQSTDSAARVAAAGSNEVEFRTALDNELSRVNQFVVSSSAELRQNVADLQRNSQDKARSVAELKASVQRCMKQVMQLDDFSSLSQAIFLRVLTEHDAISDVPMLLQYSQKLYYQPFLQTKCSDLSSPLAAIEQRLESREDADHHEQEMTKDPSKSGGIEEPLLTRRQTFAMKVVERKPPTGLFGWVQRVLNPKTSRGSTGQLLTKLTPAKIEPKVYFANERTFLHWMHMCVTLGAIAMAITAEGINEPSLVLPGVLLTAFSAIFILYAWYMFMWRGEALKAKIDNVDDRVGPSLFVVAVLCGLAFVGYKKLEHLAQMTDGGDGQ